MSREISSPDQKYGRLKGFREKPMIFWKSSKQPLTRPHCFQIKILKRGPNFEQTGEQTGTLNVKGDPKFDFTKSSTKSYYVKIIMTPNKRKFSNIILFSATS